MGTPIASLTTADDVGEANIGETSYDFVVTYSDGMSIDVSTIDISDVTVTGPGGSLTVTGANVAGGNASPKIVTYTVTPPGGSWDAADNGLYNINVVGGEVADTDAPQLFVPAGNLGSFNVDATNSPPMVIDSVAEHVIADDMGESSYTFTITYDDVNGIDTASIGFTDVTVTGPGGPLTVTSGTTTDPNAHFRSPRPTPQLLVVAIGILATMGCTSSASIRARFRIPSVVRLPAE